MDFAQEVNLKLRQLLKELLAPVLKVSFNIGTVIAFAALDDLCWKKNTWQSHRANQALSAKQDKLTISVKPKGTSLCCVACMQQSNCLGV